MKSVKLYCVLSMAALAFAGSALADQATGNPNLAKRPVISQPSAEQADQSWVGASLQTDKLSAVQQAADQKEQFRKQLNLQYASKRSYVRPEKAE